MCCSGSQLLLWRHYSDGCRRVGALGYATVRVCLLHEDPAPIAITHALEDSALVPRVRPARTPVLDIRKSSYARRRRRWSSLFLPLTSARRSAAYEGAQLFILLFHLHRVADSGCVGGTTVLSCPVTSLERPPYQRTNTSHPPGLACFRRPCRRTRSVCGLHERCWQHRHMSKSGSSTKSNALQGELCLLTSGRRRSPSEITWYRVYLVVFYIIHLWEA